MAAANGHVIACLTSAHQHAARAVLSTLGIQDSAHERIPRPEAITVDAATAVSLGLASDNEPPVPLPDVLPAGQLWRGGAQVQPTRSEARLVYLFPDDSRVSPLDIDWNHYRTLVQKDA